jgi:hypothetical protein
MVTQTNLYESQVQAKLAFDDPQRPRDWQKLSMPELKAWYGIATLNSVIPVPQIKLFWSEKETFTSILVPQIMPLSRFEQIRR